jgi:signal transduction histidine kinase
MQVAEINHVLMPVTMLIVDDRPENILTLQNIIEKENRHILTATSGNEALKILMKEAVDLVLIDVQMPDMNGFEVVDLMRLNSRTRHIPVIFVSAISKDDKLKTDKYEAATFDVLYKPLDLDETRRKVNWFEKYISLSKENELLKKQLSKLHEDFNRFTYLVTHDIKAPIRAIENLTEWIAEDMGNDLKPTVAENLNLLKNRVNRTQRLLNALTDYSRISRSNESRQPFELNKMIHTVIEQLNPPSGFHFELNGCDRIIAAEKNLMQRVFTELIKNSIQHHDRSEGVVKITLEEKDTHYVFSIKDDGPGISPENEEKVFEIFQTLHSKDQNETTGVGLALVKRIQENLRQQIWIDHTESPGLCIRFTWRK